MAFQVNFNNPITVAAEPDYVTVRTSDDIATFTTAGYLNRQGSAGGFTTGQIIAATTRAGLPDEKTCLYQLTKDSNGQITLTSYNIGPQGGVTSIIAGTGISRDHATGDVTVTNSGVTSIIAGTGISRDHATGDITVTNSGVTSIVAGSGIGISGATGAVTVSNTGVTGLTNGTNTTAVNNLDGTWKVNVASGGNVSTSASLNTNGIVLGTGTNTIASTAQMVDGQLLIGSSAGNPIPGALTYAGATFLTTTSGVAQSNPGVVVLPGSGSLRLISGVQTAVLTLNHSAILTLNTTPVTIVGAPGAGLINILLSATLVFTPSGGAANMSGNNFSLIYQGETGYNLTSGQYNASTTGTGACLTYTPYNGGTYTSATNRAIQAYNALGNPSGGNTGDTLTWYITYMVVTGTVS